MATVRPLTLGLRVAGDRVHGDLERFPVRVDLTLPRDAREAPGAGLRVRDAAGELPHRLSADGAAGRIEGWIEARRLERGRDALLFLDLGADPADMEGFSDFALFGARETDPRSPGDDFVVEGWLAADEVRAEAVQVIAAQWAFAEEVAGFATRDAGSTGGLRTRGFFGAVFDGRHVYFAPQCNDEGRHGQALRYDTRRPFDDPSAWEGYDAGATEGLVTRGYYGALFDGRYVYYVPRTDGADMHRRVLRFDTAGEFGDPSSWSARDAGGAISSQGGAFDGRYFYAAPLYDGRGEAYHGRVLRCDTLGRGGAFSLRYGDYGHNGGLCAAAPGPSFLINTETGVRSVAAYRRLPPGAHHLAGVYDGRSLRLYVDGELAARREAQGRLVECDAEVTVGELSGGSARFEGTVERVRITPAVVTP